MFQRRTGQTVELEILLLTAFLESDPRLHCFCKLSLSWELGSSLWSSEHAGNKKIGCSQRNCAFLSTLNKNFFSTFNFVSKINQFFWLIFNLSHFTHFCKTFSGDEKYPILLSEIFSSISRVDAFQFFQELMRYDMNYFVFLQRNMAQKWKTWGKKLIFDF